MSRQDSEKRKPFLKRQWPLLVAIPLLTVGSWQLGEGVYIHAKATLAQFLLEKAWAQTLDGELEVRPWAWADTWPVARLTAPDHGVDLIVLEGASGRTMAFGPGRMAGTAAIGQPGLSLIGAHRDTHFSFLQRLQPGDLFQLQSADGALHNYRVDLTEIVDHRNVALPSIDGHSTVTLVTCYPFDAVSPGGPLRYLVHASPYREGIVDS
ncbi:MAG: class GN sortase [Pseudomonadota bacterium]